MTSKKTLVIVVAAVSVLLVVFITPNIGEVSHSRESLSPRKPTTRSHVTDDTEPVSATKSRVEQKSVETSEKVSLVLELRNYNQAVALLSDALNDGSDGEFREKLVAVMLAFRNLDEFSKRAYEFDIESELALLTAENYEKKLESIASKLPILEEVLTELSYSSFGGDSALDVFFSKLASNAISKNFPVLRQLSEISDGETGERLRAELIPYFMVYNNAEYESELNSLSKLRRKDAEERMFEVSSRDQSFVMPAIKAYLSGAGHNKLYENEISSFFGNSNWIWENVEQIEVFYKNAEESPRRDVFVENLAIAISSRDKDTAMSWANLISNSELRKKTLLKLE